MPYKILKQLIPAPSGSSDPSWAQRNVWVEKLSSDDQRNEYENCLEIISKILGKNKKNFKTMSHPCGSYNQDTLAILKKLEIELGFKQIMKIITVEIYSIKIFFCICNSLFIDIDTS